MCGICGMIGKVDNKEQILQGMMKAIEHRGPDGSESYIAKEAALGFQRLSIIDLDTGMQPMFNEEGDKVLVFNGEIYNYWILKEMLVQKGHTFRTTSDSEVLLHGYEEFGEGMLSKLRGMFRYLTCQNRVSGWSWKYLRNRESILPRRLPKRSGKRR